MTNRLVFGDVYANGSFFGARASLPGTDAVTEPEGSVNVPFDTRYSNIGAAVASGLVQCGGATVYFPTMSFVPIVLLTPWDGSKLSLYNIHRWSRDNPLPIQHDWFPAVGIVDNSSLQVVPFWLPYFNLLALYNPTGAWFAYSVFAAG